MEEDKAIVRLDELIQEGQSYYSNYSEDYWISESQVTGCFAWIASAQNIIKYIVGKNSTYYREIDKLLHHDDMKNGISLRMVKMTAGLLSSLKTELLAGFAKEMEFVVMAETFDDFLDHASKFHKGNKVTESSVLASVVLEDSIKKIAYKNEYECLGKSLEEIIDGLVSIGVFTSVKAKRVKGLAAVRNKSLHAEWGEIDIRDVGELIKGTRQLLEEYLSA